MKNIYTIAFLLMHVISCAQSSKKVENHDKICIDTVNTGYLIGKWYDFTPNFYVEQANYIMYYVNKPNDLTDSTNYKGTFTIRKDGTFEKTYRINDTTFNSITGTWAVPTNTRQIKLTLAGGKYPQTWTILELNRDILILKVGI